MLTAEAVSQRNSMSHTEECQEQAFFSWIVCAAVGGMSGNVIKAAGKKELREMPGRGMMDSNRK